MKTSLLLVTRQFLSKHFMIFFGIGILCASFDFVLYLQLLKQDMPMLAAKGVASAAAVVLSYLLNASFNFGGNHALHLNRLLAYGILYAGLIAIHALINQGFYFLLGNVYLAVIAALAVSMVLNFITVKKFFARYRAQEIN